MLRSKSIRIRNRESTDAIDLAGLLRLGDERRKSESESENDREPDPPHGHLGFGMAAREFSRTARRAPARHRIAPTVIYTVSQILRLVALASRRQR
jgi:hypothetical protein